MSVLVDTSVWVAYFRNGNFAENLEYLIDENLVVTNEVILAELIPFLRLRNHRKLIDLLEVIDRNDVNIDWNQLIEFQCNCLQEGLNGIGIPDLIVAQNAKQYGCRIYSLDHHFTLMKSIIGLELFDR